MTSRSLWQSICVLVLLASLNSVAGEGIGDHAKSSTGKPLVKSPRGTKYKTILASDFGGLRGLVSGMVFIEVEKSIKRYLLQHPELLPADAAITSIEDFDIHLADYFDCITGVSAGSLIAMYLASRGGQGAAKALLENPDIVAKYGAAHIGGAEGIRVAFSEFGALVYPPEALGDSGVPAFDLNNPLSPGVLSPLYPLEGLQRALELVFGNSTLADADTTLLVPALDLISGYAVFFVKNAFKDPPVTSTAMLRPRSGPKSAPASGSRFVPDLVFDEGKNYYLKDIGAGAGSDPTTHPAMSISQVNNDIEEFVLVDGALPIEDAVLYASFFVANENQMSGLEDVAILSIGTWRPIPDYTELANAGLNGYYEEDAVFDIFLRALSVHVSLMDYLYFSNPRTRPHQYLRIQSTAIVDGGEMAAASNNLTSAGGLFEEIGKAMAQDHSFAIDIFVRDFIFG